MNDDNKSKFASLYTQITAYAIISLLFGLLMFYVVKTVGDTVIKSTDLVKNVSEKRLDYSVESLEETIQDTEDVYTEINNWVFDNKYYLVYLLEDEGALFYSNETINSDNETPLTFPTERQISVQSSDKDMQLVVVYLAAAEAREKLNILAFFLAFLSASTLFILLIKKLIDRVKWISRQLEIISAGDIGFSIENVRNDEIGALIDNINKMKDSMVNENERNAKLEIDKYEKIASMSHDLRTPLTIVMGYLEVLKDKDVDADTREYLDKIESKVGEIHDLSSDLFTKTAIDKQDTSHIKKFVSKTELNLGLSMFKRNLELANFMVRLENNQKNRDYFIEIEESFLNQIITGVESNITKYALQSEEVSITLEQSNEDLFITVDNAIAPSKEDVPSFGKGLSLLKSVLSQYDGNISYQINNDRFFLLITIPLEWL